MAEGKDVGFGSNLGESMSMDMYQREKERIQNLKEPEKSEAIRVLTASYPELAESLAEDLGYANDMMNTAMPEGRMAGQVYVAANPLEHLSSALRQGYGAKMRADTKKDQAQMRSDMQKGRAGFYGGDGQSSPAGGGAGRSMKPDLTQYGAPDIDAGMGQQTPRPQPAPKAQALRVPMNQPSVSFDRPQLPDMASHEKAPLFGKNVPLPEGNKTPAVGGEATIQATDRPFTLSKTWGANGVPTAIEAAGQQPEAEIGDPNVSMSPDRKRMLQELMSRRNLRGY